MDATVHSGASVTGAVVGAAIGSAIPIPVFGTLLGAWVGSMVGQAISTGYDVATNGQKFTKDSFVSILNPLD